MKLVPDSKYNSLLSAEKRLNEFLQYFDQEDNISDQINIYRKINNIVKLAEPLFNVSSKGYNEEEFHEKLSEFSEKVRGQLEYDFIVFGYKDENKLLDLTPYYKGNKLEDEPVNTLREVLYNKSLVGSIIEKSTEPFVWKTNENGNIFDFKNFKSQYAFLDTISENVHNKIERYFSFLEEKINELVICPISIEEEDNHRPIGYFILVNKIGVFSEKVELPIIKSIRNYLTQIFKNQTRIFQQDRDATFISSIFKKYFDPGIDLILDHINAEFGFEYSSFWVPTQEEEKLAFGLRACASNFLEQEDLKICKSQDFYLSDEFILGKISDKKITPYSDNVYIIENPTTQSTGFNLIDEYLNSAVLIVCPVIKYNHEKESSKPISGRNLGYFCFFHSGDLKPDDSTIDRLTQFVNQISFYVEHILYDHAFHTSQTITEDLITIDIIDVSEHYNNIVHVINKVMHSEHTSIFFSNEEKQLYLKASTSKEFRNVDKEQKDIIDILKKEEYENEPLAPIYIDDSSVTYRCYISKKILIVHDVHDPKISSNCSFSEATNGFHKTIIVAPIIVNGLCIGVVRCVNKLDFKDSLLKIFTFNDVDTLQLITSFISNQHLKVQALEDQQLFVEKLAHENKTPVSIIWSAIENIQFKLGELKDSKTNDVAPHFENIVFATSVLNNNYGNLNAFLRNKEKKIIYHFETIDLEEKIHEISQVLKPLLQKEENKFVVFEHNLFKMPRVKVDETRMYQVIYNLLSNAIRYCDPSSTIKTFYNPDVSTEIAESELDYFEIKFQNHGIGIPKEDSKNVFNEYFRSENAKQVNPNGTGIGLNVAKTIINGHNGEIRVTKHHGPTVISIFLPKKLLVHD